MLTEVEKASATHSNPLNVYGWCSGCMYAAYWFCCGHAWCKECLYQHRLAAAANEFHMQTEVERA